MPKEENPSERVITSIGPASTQCGYTAAKVEVHGMLYARVPQAGGLTDWVADPANATCFGTMSAVQSFIRTAEVDDPLRVLPVAR